jgi:hypothetical protein
MTHDSEMKHRERSRRTLAALLFATLTLALYRPPTADASPSSHAEIRRRVDHVVFSGRGYRVVRRAEVAASRPRAAAHPRSLPTSHDGDDARAAHDRGSSDRLVVDLARKGRTDLHRLSDTSTIIVRRSARRSLPVAALRTTVCDRRRAARETVFQDAHAPPRHA